MTKDEALAFDLALEALEKSLPRLAPYGEQDWLDSRAAITAIKQARSAPTVQEPVAWVDLLKQAEEVVRSKSLWKKYIDGTPLANDIAVWMASFAQEHTTPQAAQPANVQPVAQAWAEGYRAGIDDERTSEANIGIAGMGMKVEPARNNPYRTALPAAPASWMEMVTANLVRECVNKHKARELAEHFYSLAQRPFVGLTDEERDHIWHVIGNSDAHGDVDGLSGRDVMAAIEAKLRSKNNENTD